MSLFAESLDQFIQELLGRSSGPLHFRLLIQPTVATILAIKHGLRDAREGIPPFLFTVVTDSGRRKSLLASAWRDIGKLFVIAMVLDMVYQLVALKGLRITQTLVVAIVVAVIPYFLLRGIAARIASRLHG